MPRPLTDSAPALWFKPSTQEELFHATGFHSASDFAERIGFSRTQISRLMHRKVQPSHTFVALALSFTGKPFTDLFTIETARQEQAA